MIQHRSTRRRGFTLIEMMVAMALTIFVMTILSDAFVRGLTTFSGLKSVGDLQENLRVVTSNLRNDLSQDHFEGKRRLSDPSFGTDRPRNGFFAFEQLPRQAWHKEGAPDGVMSLRATDVLHFTVKRRGNRPETLFSALVPDGPAPAGEVISPLLVTPLTSPVTFKQTDVYDSPPDATFRTGNTFTSHWAEIAYFLVRTGTTADRADATTPDASANATDPNVIPLYQLYRVELLVVPEPSKVSDQPNTDTPDFVASHRHLSCYAKATSPTNLIFPSPADLVTPAKRALKLTKHSLAPASPTVLLNIPINSNLDNARQRATLVMSDVISFQVQPILHIAELNYDVPPTAILSSPETIEVSPPNDGSFDSGVAAAPFYPVTVGSTTYNAVLKGVIITIRGWDDANAVARQVTVIQDL